MEDKNREKFGIPKLVGEGVFAAGNIIRCVAPGFMGLYVLMFVDSGFEPFYHGTDAGYPDWVVFIGAVLSGFIIQGAHASVLVRLLWWPAIGVHRYVRKNPLLKILYDKLDADLGKKTNWDIMRVLDIQRWKRRASKDREVRSFQQQLDNWGALQNLMYCSTYLMLLIPLYISRVHPERLRPYWWHVVIAGGLISIVAVVSECRATNVELLATVEYFDGKQLEKTRERHQLKGRQNGPVPHIPKE